MRVLLTGSDGFIGAHAVAHLTRAGHVLHIMNRSHGDVAEDGTWRAAPECDAVVHLAARTFVPDSWLDPAGFIRSNVLGTIQALNYCRTRSARLVYLSSYLYGASPPSPIAEHAPLEATNPYALSKKLAEEACDFFASRYGVRCVVLRPFNVYGPGQSGDFLIPSVISQLREGKAIRLKTLTPRRDYVYVEDVASAIARALLWHEDRGTFNIGTGTSHSVAQVVDILQAICCTSLPVESEEVDRVGEINDTVADVTQIRSRLGWSPSFSLSEGLRRTVSGGGNDKPPVAMKGA